ncbi:DoxX family protein [Marinilabilia rubra]|uniref:DoxX family protein n=1 Tax=Marinilabilia rubra TaxID=2162893 RepID=A0A2U2BA12_9BACT|nr:DoxX family protein [Marinilabilia rubra]PWD99882.1 DoxX family protein [Marinilabilia rubra]
MIKLSSLGRVLYAIPFLLFGLNHIFWVDFYLGEFSSFIPLGPFTVVTTGVVLIAASISIMTRYYVKFMAYVLAGLLTLFILTVHLPHLFDDVSDKAMVAFALLKDFSLLGGSLMIAGIYKEEDKNRTFF